MLKIFFGNVSEQSGISGAMSIKGSLNTVASIFKSIRYPSTTYRIPRDLRSYATYKGNELRILLLFGYS